MNFITNEDDVKIGKGIYAMYFYTPWLIHHKKMMIMINKVKEKYKDICYMGIDASHFKRIVSIYEVESVPTIILFNNGKEIDRINGVCLTSAFKAFFDDIYKKVKKVGVKNG